MCLVSEANHNFKDSIYRLFDDRGNEIYYEDWEQSKYDDNDYSPQAVVGIKLRNKKGELQ